MSRAGVWIARGGGRPTRAVRPSVLQDTASLVMPVLQAKDHSQLPLSVTCHYKQPLGDLLAA